MTRVTRISLAVILMLGATTALTTAKTYTGGTGGKTAGYITMRISLADRTGGDCLVSIKWDRLLGDKAMYFTTRELLNLAYQFNGGSVSGTYSDTFPRYWVADYQSVLVAQGWGPILDSNGNPAQTYISNTCK